MDEYFSFLIYSSLRSGFLDFFAEIFNNLFSITVLLPFLIVFYILTTDHKRFVTLVAYTVTGIVTFLTKLIVNRSRPFYGETDFLSINASFYSGHTSSAFVLAVVLSHYYPKQAPFFYLTASFVGFFRIYSGVHYVSDVVAGALFGWLIGKIFIRYKNKVEHLNSKIQNYI